MKPFKKIIALSLVGILSATLFVGCGRKSTHLEGEELNTLFQSVGEAIIKADSTLPEMTVDMYTDENAEINFSAVCDIEYKRVSCYYHAYASDGSACEITLICADSNDDVSAIVNSLKDHLTTRRGTMVNYSPDQVEMVDNAIITTVGCYIGMFIGPKSGFDKNNFVSELEKNGIQ